MLGLGLKVLLSSFLGSTPCRKFRVLSPLKWESYFRGWSKLSQQSIKKSTVVIIIIYLYTYNILWCYLNLKSQPLICPFTVEIVHYFTLPSKVLLFIGDKSKIQILFGCCFIKPFFSFLKHKREKLGWSELF